MSNSIVGRSSHGLQEHIFQQLDRLESGQTTPQHARSVAALANTAVSLARLEMEYARFVTEQRGVNQGLPALPMGSGSAPLSA
jgi:hypothetical protein